MSWDLPLQWRCQWPLPTGVPFMDPFVAIGTPVIEACPCAPHFLSFFILLELLLITLSFPSLYHNATLVRVTNDLHFSKSNGQPLMWFIDLWKFIVPVFGWGRGSPVLKIALYQLLRFNEASSQSFQAGFPRLLCQLFLIGFSYSLLPVF